MSPSLAGRVALVTGASRGIGRAAALALARRGAHVVAVARTQGALEDLDDEIRTGGPDGAEATLVPLDLTDGDGIDRLGGAVFERWGRLDILVGNAAILGTLTPVPHIKADEWSQVLAVNVTANLRLIRAFDSLLRQSDAGRAIFVSSASADLRSPFWGAYASSKAALEELTMTYAAEMARTSVRVNLIRPGAVATAMRAKAMPGEDPDTLSTPGDIAPLFVELADPACKRHGETVVFGEWAARRAGS